MLTVKSHVSSRYPEILAYGLAVASVVLVIIGRHEMQARLHDSPPVSMFLIAVVLTAAVGGARPALLTTFLALVALCHDLLRGSPPGLAVVAFRVLALAAISGYVVWLTAKHRSAHESLRTAHETLKAKNEALEQENAERHRTEESLRSSRELLELVLSALPVGVTVTDRRGDILTANAASKTIWGDIIVQGQERWAASKGVWHHSGQRIAPSEWASARALSEGRVSLNELIEIETIDGQPKIIQKSAVPIRAVDGEIVGAVVVNEDVTEQVRTQSALRESADRLQRLSRRLLTVQEEERRHIARELHDEFGQLLIGLGLQLGAARRSSREVTHRIIDDSVRLIDSAIEQLRNLVADLRPSMLDRAGLDAALEWLTQHFARRSGLCVTLAGKIGEVPDVLAIGCFRVVQEALTNVARHAGARNVWIELKRNESAAEIEVRDDGVGFCVENALGGAADRGKFGLIGMSERAQLLGAELVLDAEPGRGTRVRLHIPIPPNEAATVPIT